jgi:hypothetical protein
MGRWLAASIAVVLGSAPWLSSRAAELVVYRCTHAEGGVSLQDTPCPPEQQQETRALRRPVDAPAAPRPPPTPVAPEPAEAPMPEPIVLREPRPLYECVRHDGTRYESESGIPERRWVPLWVLGLDPRAPPRLFGEVGRPAPKPPRSQPGLTTGVPDAGLAYGTGAWVEDRCYRLPADMTCDRRRAQLSEIGRRIFNAQQRERDRLRIEQRGLREQLLEECG